MELTNTETIISWLVGASLSILCLIIQILLYVFVPSSRKLDLKILTQITVARILNVIIEYLMVHVQLDMWTTNIVFAMYVHTDCALICWMFVFSKNLYDKVVQVFATKKMSFTLLSVLVWLLTLPIGIICPLILYLYMDYFDTSYKVYAMIKLAVLVVNLLFFCKIFYVALKRQVVGNSRGIIRTCLISFILVSISSVQVLLTDLVSFFELETIQFVFSVVNAYQTLAVMTIFVILVCGASQRANKHKSRRAVVYTP